MTYTEKQLKFLSAAIVKYGEGAIMSKESITEIAEEIGMKFPFWLTDTRRMGSFTKVDKDTYRLPALHGGEGASEADVVVSTPAVVDKVAKVVVESKNTESTFDMSTYFNPAELIRLTNSLRISNPSHLPQLCLELFSPLTYVQINICLSYFIYPHTPHPGYPCFVLSC
jgi:hypothetical protein